MRNIISIALVYCQMIYDLPMWLTSLVLGSVTYWCSTHWAGSNIIWTLNTGRWFGITVFFAVLAVAKPIIKYADRQDHEAFAAHETYLAG